MAAGKRSGKRPARQRDPEEALLRVLRHPLRRRLLRLYVEKKGMLSPKELADSTKKPLSSVGYHVRVLAEQGAVEIVAEQQRRGSVEHFYEATSLVDEVPWARAALGIDREGS
jgi:DNA-binding transcriptional ArsR family regulator